MAKSRDVVVTGVGPVTALGVGREAFASALACGSCHVSPRTLVTDVGVQRDFPMCSMPADSPGLTKHVEFLQSQSAGAHRDLAYTLLAIELALTDAALEIDRSANDVGVVQVFEAPGSEALVARMFAMMAQGACPPEANPVASPATSPPNAAPPPTPPGVYDLLAPSFYNSQAFSYVHLVGKAFGFHGFSTSVHNACSSGTYALEMAADRIRSGQADVMLVAGGEAFETGVRLEWFRRMDMYACDGVMKPFSAASHGFYVGEGAGAIVLESAEHAAARGASIYGRLRGSAFAQQSWKQVVPDVAALRLAKVIGECLARAGRSPQEIDVVVPHGAGSWISDGYEARCIELAWENAADHTVATVLKPYTGHMLGCSGVMETIGALIGMREDKVFATPSVNASECKLRLPLVDTLQSREVRTLLKVSTGFTGHDAATLWEHV